MNGSIIKLFSDDPNYRLSTRHLQKLRGTGKYAKKGTIGKEKPLVKATVKEIIEFTAKDTSAEVTHVDVKNQSKFQRLINWIKKLFRRL